MKLIFISIVTISGLMLFKYEFKQPETQHEPIRRTFNESYGNLDTIYPREHKLPPWRRFTQKEIISKKNKYDVDYYK